MATEQIQVSDMENADDRGSPLIAKMPKASPKRNRKQSVFVDRIIEVREKKGPLQAAIPNVPPPVAWICLFFNLFLPGFGTLLMAFPVLCGAKTSSKKPNRCKDFFINVATALLQFCTCPIIIGWIFSIYWGMNFVNQANEAQVRKRDESRKKKPIYSPAKHEEKNLGNETGP